MKLIQSTLQRDFTIEHKGRTYFVNYLNADGPCMGLVNRASNWEVLDEELEEVNLTTFPDITKKEKKRVDKNEKIVEKILKFCKKHFNDYRPDYKND